MDGNCGNTEILGSDQWEMHLKGNKQTIVSLEALVRKEVMLLGRTEISIDMLGKPFFFHNFLGFCNYFMLMIN